jgi:ABC-type microcin C transport system duplicated ATPase subunit YejF
MQPKPGTVGQCGCGRSPTGRCCGWHALSEVEYQQRLVEYQDSQIEKQKADELETYREQAMSLWFDNGGSCTGAKNSGTPNIN